MVAAAAATATTTTLLPFIIFLSLFSLAQPIPQIIPGLDTFLTNHFHLDPHSLNDSFHSLPSRLKSTLPSSTPAPLLSISLPVSLHVILVGGPHSTFSSSSPSILNSFLSTLLSSHPFHLITPFHPSGPHYLSVSHALHPSVSFSRASLSDSISAAISDSISSSVSSLRSPLTAVDHSIVDSIISKDFETHADRNPFTLYFIDVGVQAKPYAYRYTSSGDSSPGFTKCLGTMWIGKERYAWVDLRAGPVDYGPGLSGDGVVPKGEFHPLSALHGGPRSEKAVLADLGALVYGAYRALAVPDLRIPVPFEHELVVQFFHVYEFGDTEKDHYGLDWRMIERNFMEEVEKGGLLLESQTLKFRKHEVNYKECGVCAFAVSRSMNSYTSRFLFDNYTLIVSEYLDSKSLHQILSDSSDEIKKLAGVVGGAEEEDFGRVLQVYVFDLDVGTLLLLDRYHQSVAFKDMVIAIRTKNTQTVSDYSCNGRHVFTQTRELERPLVGSILQSMWGVSPTHLSWSSEHNSTVVDYTWSVGHTPFGPFSEISSFSFVQKDSARRNVLLTWLNDSISSSIDVIGSVNGHGGAEVLLKGSKHDDFVKRWFLFKYKLDKVASTLSRLDFKMALYYLRSSDHDLYAMHSIVYHASQEVEASLVCFKDPKFPWVPVVLGFIALHVVFYVYLNRERFFRNKRKQF